MGGRGALSWDIQPTCHMCALYLPQNAWRSHGGGGPGTKCLSEPQNGLPAVTARCSDHKWTLHNKSQSKNELKRESPCQIRLLTSEILVGARDNPAHRVAVNEYSGFFFFSVLVLYFWGHDLVSTETETQAIVWCVVSVAKLVVKHVLVGEERKNV